MIDKENGVATWEIVVFSQCVSLLYMLLYIALLKRIRVRLLTPSKNAMAMAIVITKHKGILRKQLLRTFCIGHVSHYLAYNYGSFNENTCISKCSSYRTVRAQKETINSRLYSTKKPSALFVFEIEAVQLNYEWIRYVPSKILRLLSLSVGYKIIT